MVLPSVSAGGTNALGRRVKKHVSADADDDFDSFEHFYYNAGWQILETRETASENGAPDAADPHYQFVWSPRYIDAPVLRDENLSNGSGGDPDGDCVDGVWPGCSTTSARRWNRPGRRPDAGRVDSGHTPRYDGRGTQPCRRCLAKQCRVVAFPGHHEGRRGAGRGGLGRTPRGTPSVSATQGRR